MRAFHDSRKEEYRSPFGAVRPGSSVSLRLDVWDAPGATVELRTWTDAEGEARYPMERLSLGEGSSECESYRIEWMPQNTGIAWYHFIITDVEGRVQRYGARDGSFGGSGELRDWEPPSFQVAVCDTADDEALLESIFSHADPLRRAPMEAAIAFLRNECTAYELAESIEALRETCPAPVFQNAFDALGGYKQPQLMALLGGMERDDAMREGSASLDESLRGLAKGRLWAACLLLMLAVDSPVVHGKERQAGLSQDAHAVPDRDCEDIVSNVLDLHRTLSLFVDGEFSCFAENKDVFGFWRRNGNEAVCVLLNSSLQNAYDIPVPFAGEAVSDILGGYEVPLAEDAAHDTPAPDTPSTARHVLAHLYQLGTAVLYFHPRKRLAQPLPAGVGVLAHITNLPGGTLGEGARAFVDTLAEAGIRHWQVLPVNPTDEYGSPYAGISAFAGNVALLEKEDVANLAADPDEYRRYCESEASWLEPYAAFMAIREAVGEGIPWQEWPTQYRSFTPGMAEGDAALRSAAERWRQRQFAFDVQWHHLRRYANERGISLVGDMPIYVSADSADVWANPEIFQLEGDGMPSVVAGCPPDSFAEEGQVWGNPVYRWEALAKDGYRWWLQRLKRAFSLYDYVRLDHFIGFCRYYRIPAGEKATRGEYGPGPGAAFFQAAFQEFGPLPIISEDLGMITPAVRALTATCGFPGMDIVQFADGGDPLQGYRPRPDKVVYTGTHDNQTLVGYAATRYPDADAHEVAETLTKAVLGCGAPVRILPLQDVLGLDDAARMNTPGTKEGNWAWQASASQMEELPACLVRHSRMPH